jgi:hypothetical protein
VVRKDETRSARADPSLRHRQSKQESGRDDDYRNHPASSHNGHTNAIAQADASNAARVTLPSPVLDAANRAMSFETFAAQLTPMI